MEATMQASQPMLINPLALLLPMKLTLAPGMR